MKVVNWGLQIILSTLRQAKSIIYKKITSMYPGEGIVVYWKLTDIQLPHGGRYQDKEISNIKKGHRHSKQKSISDYVKVWTAQAVGTHASLQSRPVKSCPAHDCITAALRKEKLCPCLPTWLPTPGHRQHTRHSSATFPLPPELFASRCTPRVYFTFLFPVLLYVSVAERCVKIKAAARKLGRISQGSGSGCRLLSTHTVQSSS